jgi:predicted nucleic acid-binding protein
MPSDSTVFVDTNVILYAQDPREPRKQAAAAAWLEKCWRLSCGRVSSQVLHEAYVNLRRMAPTLSADECRTVVRRYRAWGAWQVDDATVDQAWDVQDRCGFNYWDALMVAAAQMQGCSVLLTEDLQHDQRIDSKLRIVNPFVLGPEVLDAAA